MKRTRGVGGLTPEAAGLRGSLAVNRLGGIESGVETPGVIVLGGDPDTDAVAEAEDDEQVGVQGHLEVLHSDETVAPQEGQVVSRGRS